MIYTLILCIGAFFVGKAIGWMIGFPIHHRKELRKAFSLGNNVKVPWRLRTNLIFRRVILCTMSHFFHMKVNSINRWSLRLEKYDLKYEMVLLKNGLIRSTPEYTELKEERDRRFAEDLASRPVNGCVQ